MLRFFRRIRQSLFKEKKFARYLMYAVGEVVLVIIGITIAVGLNNLNEAKKQEKKIQAILKQIQTELIETIEDSNNLIEYFRQKDSLIYLVMNHKVSDEDFRKRSNTDLRFISSNYNTLTIQNDGFNNLMQKSDVLHDKYTPLISDLKEIYIDDKKDVEIMNKELQDVTRRTIAHERNNYDWYADYNFLGGALTDEILYYYLNDPNYRNSLVDYSNIAIENLLPDIYDVRIDAISAIREIDLLLEADNTYAFDVNGMYYTHWNGKYHYQGDTLEFDNDENGLKWNNEGVWAEVYPLSKTKFHFASVFFCRLVKNEKGEINGLNFHYTNSNFTYQKIKEND